MLEETLEEKQPRQVIKKQRHYFAYKDPCSQSYGFSSSHVQTWELDNKKGWLLKNWCFWTVVLEKTLESPLDSKEIKPVNSKGNQPWIFIGRSDAEAEAPILWPSDAKNWLTGKDPDASNDWRQEEKGTTVDEMVGWPSPTWWAWVWASSGIRSWTGKPGMLQSMGLQSRTWLRGWTTTTKIKCDVSFSSCFHKFPNNTSDQPTSQTQINTS